MILQNGKISVSSIILVNIMSHTKHTKEIRMTFNKITKSIGSHIKGFYSRIIKLSSCNYLKIINDIKYSQVCLEDSC